MQLKVVISESPRRRYEAKALAEEIRNLEKTDFSQTMTTRKEEQFGHFSVDSAGSVEYRCHSESFRHDPMGGSP